LSSSSRANAGDRLKLLLVVQRIDKRAGMEVQLTHLASGLAEMGHWVRIASLRSGTPSEADEPVPVDPRVQVLHFGGTGRTAGVASLRRLARLALWSDLVHCTGWDASLWGRLAALVAHRPVVVTEHTPGREHQVSTSGAPRKTFIEWHNRLLDPFTSLTVMCAEWQREMLRAEGVAHEKLRWIPNGVPVAELRSRAQEGLSRQALGIPDDAKLIAHVARFAPQKRQLLSLWTVARLRETLGDVRIVFAGEGVEFERVRDAATAMNADWAVFLGTQENVPSVFAMADLAVLPSTGEALPMAVLEAIAVRVPVVASDVGDVGDLLRRTGAGLTVAPEDAEAFFDACHRVLSDDALRARLSVAADASSVAIDAATMVDRYEDVFHTSSASAGLPRAEGRVRQPRSLRHHVAVFATAARGDSRRMDDEKAGLRATEGTPTGSLDDPEERPSQGGVIGGGKPHTDTRPSDPVPQHEVKPGEPTDDGT
jgi:glycosyltransferase involved in cell wall biosynthesis